MRPLTYNVVFFAEMFYMFCRNVLYENLYSRRRSSNSVVRCTE